MPSVDTTVGPLPLPAVAGAADALFDEPTETRLIDYVAHWLRWGLDAKLATMATPPVTNAAPVANRYTNAPSDVFLARKLPALFLYWNGKSKTETYSTVYDVRVRDFTVLYTFERVQAIEGLVRWSGLLSTVDAILTRAFQTNRTAHPTYAYTGFGAGSDIRQMFSLMAVQYLGGTPGFLRELPQEAMRGISTAAGRASAAKAQGGIQSGYPTLSGTIRVWELVGDNAMADPADVTQDMLMHLGAAEGAAGDALPDLLQRYLPAPDGSDEAAQEP